MPEPSAHEATFGDELAGAPDAAFIAKHRIVPIDCPDCGRTLAYRGHCRECGGTSWVPAGHIDRLAHKRLVEAEDGE
jgi:hypothetical protein